MEFLKCSTPKLLSPSMGDSVTLGIPGTQQAFSEHLMNRCINGGPSWPSHGAQHHESRDLRWGPHFYGDFLSQRAAVCVALLIAMATEAT